MKIESKIEKLLTHDPIAAGHEAVGYYKKFLVTKACIWLGTVVFVMVCQEITKKLNESESK